MTDLTPQVTDLTPQVTDVQQQVTISSAATALGISVAAVRRQIKAGRLHAERVKRPQGFVYLVTLPANVAPDAGDGDHVMSSAARHMPRRSVSSRRDKPLGDARDGEDAPVPDDRVIVPLPAWQRMLEQLGNLHQAGQQLAAESARAAKAETEVTFLHERIAELRSELKEAKERTHAFEQRVLNTNPVSAPASTVTTPRPWWRFWSRATVKAT